MKETRRELKYVHYHRGKPMDADEVSCTPMKCRDFHGMAMTMPIAPPWYWLETPWQCHESLWHATWLAVGTTTARYEKGGEYTSPLAAAGLYQ